VTFAALALLIGTLKQLSRQAVTPAKVFPRRRPDASVHFNGEALRARFAHSSTVDPGLRPAPVEASIRVSMTT
jgi:hypothetical protein